jgi:ATP-dependent DNA helicase
MAEMADTLLRLESEKIHVVSTLEHMDQTEIISDEALEKLLDRSPSVFEERGKGWKVDRKEGSGKSKGAGAAFEVFEMAQDETNDEFARMMGEED